MRSHPAIKGISSDQHRTVEITKPAANEMARALEACKLALLAIQNESRRVVRPGATDDRLYNIDRLTREPLSDAAEALVKAVGAK